MADALFVLRNLLPLRVKKSVLLFCRRVANDELALPILLNQPIGCPARHIKDIVSLQRISLVTAENIRAALPAKKQCLFAGMRQPTTGRRARKLIDPVSQKFEIRILWVGFFGVAKHV